MKAFLIDETHVIASSAPGKMFISTVVCFEDSFYIILHQDAYTFGVDVNPVAGYNFGNKSVAEGGKEMIDSAANEDELKAKLFELIGSNPRCVVNFSNFKKVKIKGLFGVKNLKAMNSAMNYVTCTVPKAKTKELMEFYPNL